MPKGLPPPRPSVTTLPKVVEQSASPPEGEPRTVPHRDRQSTLPGDTSARVVSDRPHDDPVEALREELRERDRQMGLLLAQVGALTEQLGTLQHQAAADSEPPPSPAAWKKALFKLVVSFGALATAASVWLGARNVNLPPKVDAQQARTEVVETKSDTTAAKLAALDGRVAMLERRDRDWISYWIEVERLQGVQVRRPEGLQDPPKIEVVVPLRRAGESGPSLYVNTPPW